MELSTLYDVLDKGAKEVVSDILNIFHNTMRVRLNASLLKSNIDNLRWIDKLKERSEFKNFQQEIIQYYEDTKETQEGFDKKMQFKNLLEYILHSLKDKGFNWRFKLVPTGSTVTNLAAKNSDFDLCFFSPDIQNEFSNELIAAKNVLQIIRHTVALREEEGFDTNVKYMNIVFASVPVLKIVTKDDLELDLSVCTKEFLSGAHNSLLLRAYGCVDPRFIPLCVFVKKWATVTRIKNPRGDSACFNSYAIICLVIHFLQCGVYPPILPNLQMLYPEYYAISEQVYPPSIDFNNPLPPEYTSISSENNMCIGELFIRFLQYYLDFDFKSWIISLKDSCIKRRSSYGKRSAVLIEDPIDHHNPGRTARDIPFIKEVIRRTLAHYRMAADSTAFPFLGVNDIKEGYLDDNRRSIEQMHSGPVRTKEMLYQKAELSFCIQPEKLENFEYFTRQLLATGRERLVLICDFDNTLTTEKSKITHQSFPSSVSVPYNGSVQPLHVAQKYLNKEFRNRLETNVNTSLEDINLAWWRKSHDIIAASTFCESDLDKCVENIDLRPGARELLVFCEENNVRLLIFSAGITNIIEAAIVRIVGPNPRNVFVLANEMSFQRNGSVSHFVDPLIHSLNKNYITLIDHVRPVVEGKEYAIMLGDSLTDVEMMKKWPGVALSVSVMSSPMHEFIFDAVLRDNRSLNTFTDFLRLLLNETERDRA